MSCVVCITCFELLTPHPNRVNNLRSISGLQTWTDSGGRARSLLPTWIRGSFR